MRGRLLLAAILPALWLALMSWVPPIVSDPALPAPLRPHRPLWIHLINGAMPPIMRAFGYNPQRTPSFHPDDLIRAAQQATGHIDLADEDGLFGEGLRRLSTALDAEADLNVLGRIIVREQLVQVIGNRLKLLAYNATHIRKEPRIIAPVFTIGMPRSGTTFLHNLLSRDAARFQALRTWQVVDPVPPLPPDASWLATLRRLLPIRGQMEFYKILARNVHTVYPLGPMNAEECMPILGLGMVSLQYNVLSNVSSYDDWQSEVTNNFQGALSPFTMHKLFFHVLQSSVPEAKRSTWLFKAPWHMNHLSALFAAYPDAKVIMPHRDPTGCIASLSSLHARFYGITSDNIRLKEIGAHTLKRWTGVAKRFSDQRTNLTTAQQAQILDLQFADLLNRPIETVRQIYKHFNWQLSREAESAMREWLDADVTLGKKGARGVHEYSPEWFGLDENKVTEAFQDYCKRYKVPTKYSHSKQLLSQ